MIHKITENVPKTTDYYVAPCINCNCDNISIDEYEDQIGYITTLKCTQCKNEIKINKNIVGGINEWNDNNDINLLITNKTLMVDNLKNEIKQLKIKLKKRKKT